MTIPPDVWTHIAVVFKPVEEERMDEILGIVAMHCFLIPRKYDLPDGGLFLHQWQISLNAHVNSFLS